MKFKNLILALAITIAFSAQAARVDTVMVKSPSMNKEVKVVYIVPDKAIGKKSTACPVIYLLHGYGDNEKTWLLIKTDLPEIADEKGIIFACPDGKRSWYWDSPKDSTSRYETFISSELIHSTDSLYNTVSNRKGRAITGLSMGGHGALWNAFRHTDVFGAAGSSSGGVDIRPFPNNWGMNKLLGEMTANKKVWDEHTVINQIDRLKNNEIAIIIDCGENDFFLEVNKELHQRLLGRGIDHDFTTRPGIHRAYYWRNSIDYQILFFEKFFKKAK